MDTKRQAEWEQLQAMVNDFTAEMKARLYQKIQEGYNGWDDPAQVDGIAIRAMADAGRVSEMEHNRKIGQSRGVALYLNNADELRRCVDAANRLAMVWHIRGKEAMSE